MSVVYMATELHQKKIRSGVDRSIDAISLLYMLETMHASKLGAHQLLPNLVSMLLLKYYIIRRPSPRIAQPVLNMQYIASELSCF